MASPVVKWVGAGVLVMLLAVGGEVAWIHHRNAQDEAAPATTAAQPKMDPDDEVYLKSEHPMSLKDEKDLKGRTLWISAGGQMEYFPFAGGKVDFSKSQGLLWGAQPIMVKDAVEQVAPAKAATHVPAGDKQVFVVFTKPGDDKEYATAVGYKQAGDYTFESDQMFFYDDPHKLFGYWGPDVWKAIDAHQAQPGMSERQVQMALGQVSTPHGDNVGNRTVTYDNQGHPVDVTFVNGKATTVKAQS
jgi:hypothetical protein